MRYRPFGSSGAAISVISLLIDGAGDRLSASLWRDLTHTAFELGINAFVFQSPTPAQMAGFAEASAAVRRNLLFVGMRLDPTPEGDDHEARLRQIVDAASVGYFDLIAADGAPGVKRPPAAWVAVKDTGLAHALGICGGVDDVEAALNGGGIDALIAPFGVYSGWRERNMIRSAMVQNVAVIASDAYPASVAALAQKHHKEAKAGWFKRREPLAGAGSYAFLEKTPGWTGEQICVAYALTEPAIVSVLVSAEGPGHLAGLADVAERVLPSAVAAQIEMARFSGPQADATPRRA